MKPIIKFKVTEGRYDGIYYDGFYLAGGIDHVTKSEVTCNRSGVVSCLNISGNNYAVIRYSVVDDDDFDRVDLDINIVKDNKVTSYPLRYEGIYLNNNYYREYVKEFVFSIINGEDYDFNEILGFLIDHNITLEIDPFEGYPDGIIVMGE